jgi:hypothetical protein
VCKDLDDEIVYEDEYCSGSEIEPEKIVKEESVDNAPLSLHVHMSTSLVLL